LKFYKFPLSEETKKIWFTSIRRSYPTFKVYAHSVIESDSLEYFCTAGTDIDEEEDTSMFLYLEQSQYTSYLIDTTQYISGFVVRKIK